MTAASIGLACGFVVVAPPAQACACGGFVDAGGYETSVDRETAVLQWDGRRQTAILELGTFSDAPEVGLLIPTPTPAEVDLGDAAVFTELGDITRPQPVVDAYRWWPEFAFGSGGVDGAPQSSAGVSVLSEVRLGPLDVSTLSATDPATLQQWLTDNGFQMSEAFSAALAPYVDEGWYYVAARIAPEEKASFDGTLEPLRVTFASDRFVYPMRLSAAAELPQNVRTYVLSDHRVERDDATAEETPPTLRFAGEVDPASVDAPELAALLEDGGYVTAHDNAFDEPSSQVVSDFEFVQAADDDPYVETYSVTADKRIGPFYAGPVLLGGGVVLLGGAAWATRHAVRTSRRRA